MIDRIDANGIIHLAVRTERIASDEFWAPHRRELLTIAAQLREIAREERRAQNMSGPSHE